MRKKEWDEINRRAERVLTNGTTSGSARALANDVKRLIAEVEFRREKMREYEDLIRRQMAVLEHQLTDGDKIAEEIQRFLRDRDED